MISSAGLSPSGVHLHVSASGAASMVTHDRVNLGYSISRVTLKRCVFYSLFMRYFLAVNHEHL